MKPEVKLIALTSPGTRFAAAPAVAITVGRPGVDHDAVLFDPASGHAGRARGRYGGRGALGGRCARPHPGGAAMLTLLAGGRVIDPAHGRDETADLWFEDGRIVAPAGPRARCAPRCRGGHRDGGRHRHPQPHRRLQRELRAAAAARAARGRTFRLPHPSRTRSAGSMPRMGFTTVVEPAISPHVAVQAQLELAAIPWIDKAILVVLGNEDFLLELLRGRCRRRGGCGLRRTDARGRTRAGRESHQSGRGRGVQAERAALRAR